MRPLAVVGNLSRDRVDGGRPRVGGAPFHASRALRLLGRRAVVAAKCARADRAELLPPLVALGIPVRWRPSCATAAFAFDYDGDERRMTVESLGEAWRPEEARGWVADALDRAEWVHVGALARSDFAPETLAALARRGRRRISLDGQGLARPDRTGVLELDDSYDREALKHVSILKLSEEEAQALVGEPDEAALRSLEVPEVVVTLGSRGSLVFAEGKLEKIVARPVEADPTGAGDAFAIAYIAFRSGGQAPYASARRASSLVAGLLGRRAR